MPITRLSSQKATQAAECRMDPLEALGPDVLRSILAHLPAPRLQACALVSPGWRLCARDDKLWEALCQAAWDGLVYVPAARRADLPWKQRFLMAEADAQRTAITVEELCAFRWSFRFKPEAGEYWLAMTAGYKLHRLFREDGSVRAPPTDPIWGEHESRWRFCKTQHGVPGHYVKINHWPSLRCSRTPDGGWRMENVWVEYRALLAPGGPYRSGLHPGLARHLEG